MYLSELQIKTIEVNSDNVGAEKAIQIEARRTKTYAYLNQAVEFIKAAQKAIESEIAEVEEIASPEHKALYAGYAENMSKVCHSNMCKVKEYKAKTVARIERYFVACIQRQSQKLKDMGSLERMAAKSTASDFNKLKAVFPTCTDEQIQAMLDAQDKAMADSAIEENATESNQSLAEIASQIEVA